MFDKKKLNFWRLFIIFSGFTFITLYFLWSAPQVPNATMMTDSMGSTMKEMHLNKATSIYDLFSTNSSKAMMGSIQSHHENESQIMKSLNQFSTLTIFILLPFILGGTVFLAVIWIK